MINSLIYKAVLLGRKLMHPNGVKRTINGIPCRFTTLYAKGVPEKINIPMLDSIVSKAKDSKVMLELGGHIGIWTEIISNSMPQDSKIFVFEPNPNTFKTLTQQAAASLSKHKITLLNKAAGETDGNLQFEMFPDRSRSFDKSAKSKLVTSGSGEPGGVMINVPVVSIDSFCKEKNITPDLIKIDIEGAELLALKGMKKILSEGKTRIVIEMHQFAWPEFGYSGQEFIDYLAQFSNYRLLDEEGKLVTSANEKFMDNNTLGFVELLPVAHS